jgi:ankyrin repeat protein
MGINKTKSFEPERSGSIQSQSPDSMRSTPSVPPKESFTSTRPNQNFRQQEPEIVTDDMSSVLSLNGFLNHQPRETEKSLYFEHRALPRRPAKTDSTVSAEEISLRNDSSSDRESASAKLTQTLLAHGVNLKDEAREGTTLLIEAIRKRAPQHAIETLLNTGCDPNRKDDHGKTALCEAVQSDQPSIVTTLLNQDANPNLPGPEHVLWSAVHRPGCLRILLARGADIKKAPGLMEQATSVNSIDAVRVLLQAGMDPNSKKDGIYTPLCSAIRDDRPDILALLLHHGADPNLMASEYPAWKCITHNRLQFLPDLVAAGADLHKPPGIVECAVQNNNTEALHWLVGPGGANPNDRSDQGHTAVTTAIRLKRPEMLEWLLAHGADPNLRGKDWPIYMASQSPTMLRLLLPGIKDLSAHKGVMEKAVQANQLENVKLLIAAGASVEWKNGGVFSPLTTALRERHWVIVRYLLDEAGADPNAPGEHLPLVKAIRRCDDGDFAMIELLLERGADPNRCYRDWNAIMQAIEDRDLQLLQLLIEKGGQVDLTQKDETGNTVLDMANSSGWLEGTELLLQNSCQ